MSALVFLLVVPAAAAPLVEWDFEVDDGGFVSGGETGQWAWGEPTAGPGVAVEGTRAWSTVLDGPHLNDTTDTLTLPPRNLSDTVRPVLGFSHWFELAAGDSAWLEVRDDAGWTRLEPVYGYPQAAGFTGQSSGWQRAWFDLSGVGDLRDVRLVLSADRTVALAGWTVDAVQLDDGDAVPPSIRFVSGPGEEAELLALTPLAAEVRDDIAVAGVDVAWTVDGGSPERAPLDADGGDIWTGGIPAVPPDSRVEWWLEATDGTNIARTEPRETRFFLPAPTALTGPSERVVARSVRVGWTPAPAAWPQVDHIVYVDGVAAATSVGPSATVPVAGRDPDIVVRTRFETPFGVVAGDPSATLSVDLAYPMVAGISPAEGYQGDQIRLDLQGVDLFLVAGSAAASLGEGVAVRSFEVIDVNTARLDADIAEDAAPGVRDLVLLTDDVVVPLQAAFSVLSGTQRPALESVEPDAVSQGTRHTLQIQLTAPPAGTAADLRLDAGPGVIVESLHLEASSVTAGIAVTADAPVGTRALLLDDGVRLLEGASLRIRKPPQSAGRVCGVAPPATTVPAVSLLLLAIMARRRPWASGVTLPRS
ncbi:MAG: hypothetical protein VX265_15225 [Myxococcota bacterium]|nr:hypothetical protein [Myxococcota bacterium]